MHAQGAFRFVVARRRRRACVRGAAVLALASSCAGTIGDGAEPASSTPPLPATPATTTANPPGGGPTGGPAEPRRPTSDPVVPPSPPGGRPACAIVPGPAPLRRLTAIEYDNTVRDLFPGFALPPLASQLPGDNVRHFFDNNAAAQRLSQAHVEGFLATAEAVSERVTADVPKLLGGCHLGTSGEEPCALDFLRAFGARAFRRPLTRDESQRLATAYRHQRMTADLRGALRSAIERVLQSPQFLFRLEGLPSAPGGTGVAAFPPYEIASRLSYVLWASPPDPKLLDAAASGALASATEVRVQATRLLADPRARASVLHFFRQWLEVAEVAEVTKSPSLFKGFTPDIAHAMAQEVEAFVGHVGLEAGVRYDALFTAPYTFQNKALAAFFGRTAAGATFERIALDPARFAGIVTMPGILALNATAEDSSPIFRGRFVRERLLCDELPPPPPGVPDLPAISGDKTVREIHEIHATAPACAACHQLVDPIGFGLETFDAVGRWRERYRNGKAVDAQGQIAGDSDAAGPFSGAAQLGARLGQSTKVRQCLSEQLLRYALGRDLYDSDGCAIAWVSSSLGSPTGNTVRDALLAVVTSEAFLRRAP
jgi:hypothetical protein